MLKKFFVITILLILIGIPSVLAAPDTTKPTTTKALSPASPNGKNGWYTQPVNITLTATDLESGVKEINYKINTGSWIKASFPNSLNLLPNPSFETAAAGSNTQIEDWAKTTPNETLTTYTQSTEQYLTGYETASAKIVSTEAGWHGINNQTVFAPAEPFANMSASAWVKTMDLPANAHAFFKIYAVYLDENNNQQTTLISQSNTVQNVQDWRYLSTSFIVNVENAIGVYMDIGIENAGTVYIDAVSLTESLTSAQTTFTLPSDGQFQIEYFSVDQADNIEQKTCVYPNCPKIKIDQTSPTDWQNAGAFRGIGGPAHYLWVYTNVSDITSGLSTFTDKYQYKTELNPTFGAFPNLSSCNGSWIPDDWNNLYSIPFFPGAGSGYLLTQRTNFCNNNWSSCKYVKFFAEDMAGNTATKDYCINGPWIKLNGEGITRGNAGIDMIAEATTRNTDGLIESGNNEINYFTSSERYEVKNSTKPITKKYDDLWTMTTDKTTITNQIPATSGVYYINGNFSLTPSATPNNYTTASFNQIVFINGNLNIEHNLALNTATTVLFVVKGNVNISKNVTTLHSGIISDQTIYTASDIANDEPTQPITIEGMLVANQFDFQRTLQGTNNTEEPSEIITYKPKFLITLKGYFRNNNVTWISSN